MSVYSCQQSSLFMRSPAPSLPGGPPLIHTPNKAQWKGHKPQVLTGHVLLGPGLASGFGAGLRDVRGEGEGGALMQFPLCPPLPHAPPPGCCARGCICPVSPTEISQGKGLSHSHLRCLPVARAPLRPKAQNGFSLSWSPSGLGLVSLPSGLRDLPSV